MCLRVMGVIKAIVMEVIVQKIISVSLIVVGIVHLLPISGVCGGARLEQLYGMTLAKPDMVMFLRHRIVLFDLEGGL